MALVPEARSRLIDTYASCPARVREAFTALPSDAVRWHPASGEFSAHQIVHHLADACAVGYARIRFLVAETAPFIPAWDEESWARELDYHRLPLEPAFATIDSTVDNTIPLLRLMSESDWIRTGTHSAAGVWSADDWLQQHGSHPEVHIAQLRSNLEAWTRRG